MLCTFLVLGLSIGAAWILPPKYTASITILVEQEETLNPMVRFNLAVALASEDRLRSFNEIIYSRSAMNTLIDSLGLAGEEISLRERQELIREVRGNISTNLRASDSFSITYKGSDPERVRKAVSILSDYFIKTKLQLENKRNNQTVEFFQIKLEELAETVEKREKEMVKRLEEDVKSTPREIQSLQLELDRITEQIDEMTPEISNIRNRLGVVKAVNNGSRGLKALYELDLSSIASGEEMGALLNDYENYSRRYTASYPRVQELEDEIRDLTGVMITEIEADLFSRQAQKTFLERQYEELAALIQQSTLTDRQTRQTQLDMDIYRELYDEMKIKLEQAKTNRDLGKNAKEQFIVIDPPITPQEPSEPNRIVLIGGGLILGLFLGLLAAVIAELLDTTVRRPQDLKKFNKPVIAFISEKRI